LKIPQIANTHLVNIHTFILEFFALASLNFKECYHGKHHINSNPSKE
jgi:hypothetical protein